MSYKLMIVDDDEIVRAGLIKNIPWAEHQIHVSAIAKNGREAIERLEENMPDVIISDIEMPFMDGLRFAEYINKFYPKIKIILLTAYKEFTYAVQAVDYNVFRYVLKYEENQVILQAVQEAIIVIEKEMETQKFISENKTFLVRNFLKELSYGSISTKEIKKHLEEYQLTLESNYYCSICISMKVQQVTDRPSYYIERKRCLNELEIRLKEKLMGEGFEVYAFEDKENLHFIIGSKEYEQGEALKVLLEQELMLLKEEIGEAFYGSMGNWHEGIEQVATSYLEAMKALELKETLRNDACIIHFGTDIEGQGSAVEVVELISNYIRMNYHDENLSLNHIADTVYLSPNYISTLYKKYKGINIIEDITSVRLQRAEKLLIETNYKTYEVAYKIGYTNAQYFSVLFKKVTGMTPTEYRQKNVEVK